MTGLCYKNGWGVERSVERAHEYLLLAAETLSFIRGFLKNSNNEALLSRACSEIGHLYQENLGTEESCMHAISWYESAENYFEIAEACRLGRGVKQSDEQALEYYKKAIERGYYRAFCPLGKCYQSGYLVERSDAKAFECFQKAKDAYDGFAYFNVGECYRLGKGIPWSFEKALEYYRKGLIAGSLESSVGIAKCLFESQCIEGADAVGLEFLRIGAAFKNREALYNLGECYRKGLGVELSDSKAVEYYKEAAEAGLAEAIFSVGVYRQNGFFLEGISAISCFEEAARMGVSKAYSALGECYRLGIEVDQSSEKAFACYEKAAEEGVPEALFELGNIYLLGRGVEISEEKAFHYFKQSADHGFDLNACKIWLHHFLSEVITIADFTDRGSDIKQLRKIRNTVATEDLGEFVKYLSRWDIGGIAQMWKLFERVSPTSEDSPICPLNRGWRVCRRKEGLESLKKSYGSLISSCILKGFPSFVRLMKIMNFLEVEEQPLSFFQDGIGEKDEQRRVA